MGVLHYFKFINNNYGNVVTEIQDTQKKKSIGEKEKKELVKMNEGPILYIDANNIIHKVVQTNFKSNYKKKEKENAKIQQYYNLYYEQIVENIYELIMQVRETNPELRDVRIHIDGVPCFAKMYQQRKRRHMFVFKRQLVAEMERKEVDETMFNSNLISPGTTFMRNLVKHIKKKFKTVEFEEDEAEHRIYDEIKNITERDRKIYVYGMDADLIQLGLISKQADNIYILRHRKQYNEESEKLIYISIKNLKKEILKEMMMQYKIQEFNMHSYIFIIFMFGNDFLPKLSYIRFEQQVYDIVFNEYRKTQEIQKYENIQEEKEKHNIVDEKGNLEMNFLRKYLQKLQVHEEIQMNKYISEYKRKKPWNMQDKLQEIEQYPLYNKYLKIQDYRQQYYYIENVEEFDQIIQQDMCHQYIQGLKYTLRYYNKNKNNSNYCYKYKISPTLNDLREWVMSMKVQELEKKTDEYEEKKINLDVEQNLLYVLPYHDKNQLKQEYRKLVQQDQYGMSQYYPIKFQVNTYLKNYIHECDPLILDCPIQKLVNITNQQK